MPRPPRTYRLPRPTPRNRTHEVIGRYALAVIALALLWGGYKCVRTGLAIQQDFNQRHAHRVRDTRSSSGSFLPFAAGIVLFVIGTPLLTAAVVPVSVTEKLLGRQTNNTLWQNPDPGTGLRDWNGFL